MTKHKQILPPANLSEYIYCFGEFKNNNAIGNTSFKLVVDGCPGLIFQEYPDSFVDKNGMKLPQTFLHGVFTKPTEKIATAPYKNIGVYFKPHAIKSFFDIDAWELTNKYADINDLLKTDLTEKILSARSMEQQAAIISNFLTKQLATTRTRQKELITFAIERIATRSTEMSISNLCSSLNLSERVLERMFKTHIGITPILFSRISRFKKTLDYIQRSNQHSLTSIAYDCDYADQSHWIREFKEFSGFTPKQYLRNADEKLINFPESR